MYVASMVTNSVSRIGSKRNQPSCRQPNERYCKRMWESGRSIRPSKFARMQSLLIAPLIKVQIQH
jgi:hypothetical protein